MDPRFVVCDVGRYQSPIDITNTIGTPDLAPLEFAYKNDLVTVKHLGHTIYLEFGSGSFLTFEDTEYELKQLRFHIPGQHLVDGMPFDMEVNLLHEEATGKKLMLAVLINEGSTLDALKRLWRALPGKKGAMKTLSGFNAAVLIPKNRSYYRYPGSLPYPPCTEGVQWVVLANTISLSPGQIDQYTDLVQGGNKRPVQSAYSRVPLRSR